MNTYKSWAYMYSLNKGLIQPTYTAEITVLDKIGDNDYIVDYNGIKCHALFNPFVCALFADDIYRRVEQ